MREKQNRRAVSCSKERSAPEDDKSEVEKLAESIGANLSESYYPFENNVDFEDTPKDETMEGSEPGDSETVSVPPTPPSSPINELDRQESGPATLGPKRDPRPPTVSRRAWHKFRRMAELQQKIREEEEQHKLRDKVTGRRDQSREAQEARLCGYLCKEGAQLSTLEGATPTFQKSSSLNEAVPPIASPSKGIQDDDEADKALQKEEEASPSAPFTRDSAVKLQNEQVGEPKEEESRKEVGQKSAPTWPSEELTAGEDESRGAPTIRRTAVSWHPVAEVVTVEAGSPATQRPVERSTTNLVEKSTLRACRRIMDRPNAQLGSNSSSSKEVPK
ncbi:hypothetical protein, conserved [Eimeria brunetti]|uniref:Uncharacterized protein n=1 Tax=Eimeria brunetti TaxID=51314 RepID=U6LEJ8_9EIME|nr:hypothetical protein, conserved [Eimeria brunetti]